MQPDGQNSVQDDDNNVNNLTPRLEMYQPVEESEDTSTAEADAGQVSDSEDDSLVQWSANDSTENEKNRIWYIVFSIVVVFLIALDLFALKSYTFSVLVVVMTVTLLMLSRRPPQLINYSLTEKGLYIGQRLYSFGDFKSFGLIDDQKRQYIMLLPIKRLSPGLVVYFPFEAGEKIVDFLGARLPMQELKLDVVDKIVQKLHL